MRLVRTVALLAAALAACSPEERVDPLPPADRFYYPIGLATASVGAGPTRLLVASSNFDLRYSAPDGGTLHSVGLDDCGAVPTPASCAAAPGPVTPLDVVPIASYAGPLAVADAAACGMDEVLVASRYEDVLYRFTLQSDGSLACGPGCRIDLDGRPDDPFAVAVACGSSGHHAFVGFLDTPDSTRGAGAGAWIAEVDLDSAEPTRILEIGDGPIRALAYEREADRLWLAARSSGERALLYSVVLSDPTWRGSSPWEAMESVDLADQLDLDPLFGFAGLELRSLALGTYVAGEPRRLYAVGRLYDKESQATSGVRPSGDVGGVLLALEVTESSAGTPEVQVAGYGRLGTGARDVAVVPYLGSDYVLVTAVDGDKLTAFDEDGGDPVWELGHDAIGLPLVGDRPIALAVDADAAGGPDVYVGSFGDHLVRRFKFDPADPPELLWTLGGLDP